MAAGRIVASVVVSFLLGAAVAPAYAGSMATVRDEFNDISFAGNDGSADWSADWIELPFGDGPTDGQIQVVSDSRCTSSNCLRIGPDEVILGAVRSANLAGYTSASLTFSYRRELLDAGDGDGRIWVRAGSSIWSWETVAAYSMSGEDSSSQTVTLDISDWAGGFVHVGFFGAGDLGGYFYVDDVEIAMSTNRDPSFDWPLPSRSDQEGERITIRPQVSDPDGDDLSFSATGLPNGASINADTGVISGTLGYNSAHSSPYTTVVAVEDGLGGRATTSFIWRIADVNRAPYLAPVGDGVAAEGSLFRVTTWASDPDLPHDSLRYTLVSAPSGATVNSSGRISWTPAEAAGPGTHSFTVKVTDAGGPPLSATTSFDVFVSETNRPPVLDPVPDQAHGVGDEVSLSVSATDADVPANRLSYQAAGLPSGVSISRSGGIISGTIPGDAPQSSNTVTITVSDDGDPPLTAIRTFSWQVTRGNHAPVLDPIADQAPDGTGIVTFVATATDSDVSDTVSFWLADGIDPVPAGASVDPTTGKFTWEPTADQHDATYRVNIGVSDSGSPRLSDTQLVTIVVPKLNEPPSVVDPGDQIAAEGDVVRLQIDARDEDGVRFSAAGLPAGLSINAVTGVISGTVDFAAGADSPHSVVVTAIDDGTPSKTGSVEFTWDVTEVNRPPVIDPISVVALVGTPIAIDVSAEDPDGDELSYEVAGEPIAGSLEGEGPEFVYTTPGGATEDGFTVVANDGELETRVAVSIRIRAGNSPPTADADNYNVDQGESLVVDAPGVMGNDSDLDAEILVVGLVSPPAHGVLELRADGSFEYTPFPEFSGGDKFVYSVTDAFGESSTAIVVLNVAAREAALPPAIDDGQRMQVVAATTSLWQPATIEERSLVEDAPRVVVEALGAGVATVPVMRYPLLLLAIALLAGLTLGRISTLPFGVGKRQEEGTVQSYDAEFGVGNLTSEGGDGEVFVQARSLEKLQTLTPGQRVRFIAADIRGRRIALKVWPLSS